MHGLFLYPTPEGLVNLIMPHRREKIKEESMSLREDLDHLEIAVHNVSQGINALGIMALGLSSAKDPYADGFNALYLYLSGAGQELRQCLDTCWNTF